MAPEQALYWKHKDSTSAKISGLKSARPTPMCAALLLIFTAAFQSPGQDRKDEMVSRRTVFVPVRVNKNETHAVKV